MKVLILVSMLFVSVSTFGIEELSMSGVRAFEAGNYTEAFNIFSSPSIEGDSVSQFFIGVMYNYGLGVEKSQELSVKNFEASAKQGHAGSLYYLGLIKIVKIGDVSSGINDLIESAKRGDKAANSYLGALYMKGRYVAKDENRGLAYIKSAAVLGDSGSQYTMYRLCVEANYIKCSKSEEDEWLSKAAESGNEDAMRIILRRQE